MGSTVQWESQCFFLLCLKRESCCWVGASHLISGPNNSIQFFYSHAELAERNIKAGTLQFVSQWTSDCAIQGQKTKVKVNTWLKSDYYQYLIEKLAFSPKKVPKITWTVIQVFVRVFVVKNPFWIFSEMLSGSCRCYERGQSMQSINRSTGTIRVLGIHFSYNKKLKEEKSFYVVITNISLSQSHEK